ncbi:hypothetical protein SLS62_005796 [Diatrype stigma]|uniref:Integral membrane protein n=1 Tax=Diatrype stigma TaxID=117547 RepID=A0AAN9USF1_9PEZI
MSDVNSGNSSPRTVAAPMPSVPERGQTRARSQSHSIQTADFQPFQGQGPGGRTRPRLLRQVTNMVPGRRGSRSSQGNETEDDEYDADIVDILDVVDPEVATLSSITNVQNSLFIPSLGRFVNRQPTYRLSHIPRLPGSYPSQENIMSSRRTSAAGPEEQELTGPVRPSIERVPSTMTERFYAVRPHNATLDNWTEEEIAELNDHVRHMLHSRRNKMKRRFKAFGQYMRRPLGFLVTVYATLITLFGLAWVLFLIGWIYVGDQQPYVINVIDTVLVSLFALVGDGLIPWRIVDTYHMCYIAHYHHLTWKLRNKLELPHLQDKNDLPSEPAAPRGSSEDNAAAAATAADAAELDLEAARTMHEKEELTVLTPAQQRKLEHHQAKFSKSHTFYKPHETETHYAFPLRLLVAIVVLLDCHSIFQLGLGLCTWCIDYRVRPMALTATLLSFSISANITAGVLISVGDRRTRKKDVIERMFRQELTQEAMKRVNKAKAKETLGSPTTRDGQQPGDNDNNNDNHEDGELVEEKKRGGGGAAAARLLPPSASRRLERIDEGKESRTSRDFPFRPKLDFLRKSSDRARRSSGESSRKSIDKVGRFDSTKKRETKSSGSGGSSNSSGSGSKGSAHSPQAKAKGGQKQQQEEEGSSPRAIGAFPEEEEEEAELQPKEEKKGSN